MNLSSLRVRVKNKKTHRRGRGTGSGSGKTAGRGNKGAGQRKGKTLPYVGFRGGNLPLLRTLPKRGFTSLHPKDYQLVNLGDIQQRAALTAEFTPEVLEKLNLIKHKDRPIKILAGIKGEFKKKIKIKADTFSAKAKELIESQGGSVECLNR